jgi:hypothetical protein
MDTSPPRHDVALETDMKCIPIMYAGKPMMIEYIAHSQHQLYNTKHRSPQNTDVKKKQSTHFNVGDVSRDTIPFIPLKPHILT